MNQKIIDNINKYQENMMFHPLTCGNDSNHILKAVEVEGKVILRCPECDYVQNWVPALPILE